MPIGKASIPSRTSVDKRTPKTIKTMNRKDYEKPAMRVVDIQQQGMLMQSNPLQGGKINALTNYSDGGDPFEED